MRVLVDWPSKQSTSFGPFELPKLPPGKPFKLDETEANVLSPGIGMFHANIRTPTEGPIGFFYNPENPTEVKLGGVRQVSFHIILGKHPAEIYEFWGMLFAAFSLFIIVLEKIVQFFLWALSIPKVEPTRSLLSLLYFLGSAAIAIFLILQIQSKTKRER